jgi:hypothetical protein
MSASNGNGTGDDHFSFDDAIEAYDISSAPPAAPPKIAEHRPTLMGPGPAVGHRPPLIPGARMKAPPAPVIEPMPIPLHELSIDARNARSSRLSDRVTPMSAVAAVPEPEAPLAWLSARAGMVGYAHTGPNGEALSELGRAPEGLHARFAFVRQVAQSIGTELSLENLNDVHVQAKDVRAASLALEDGSIVDIQTTSLANTHEIARKLRR